MGANLVQNVKLALKSQNVRSVTCWTDRAVVLYWLNEKGNYKKFVGNKVNKIRETEFINWCYVPTKENPANIGSKGSLIVNISRVWWEGPSWLPGKTKWPDQPFITSTNESEKGTKRIKELVTTARVGSRAAATSKMECFVIVNGFQSLTIITKRSILNVAAVLDPPLNSYSK